MHYNLKKSLLRCIDILKIIKKLEIILERI